MARTMSPRLSDEQAAMLERPRKRLVDEAALYKRLAS